MIKHLANEDMSLRLMGYNRDESHRTSKPHLVLYLYDAFCMSQRQLKGNPTEYDQMVAVYLI